MNTVSITAKPGAYLEGVRVECGNAFLDLTRPGDMIGPADASGLLCTLNPDFPEMEPAHFAYGIAGSLTLWSGPMTFGAGTELRIRYPVSRPHEIVRGIFDQEVAS